MKKKIEKSLQKYQLINIIRYKLNTSRLNEDQISKKKNI